MTIALGAHIGQQNMSADEMRAVWRKLDAAGLDWLSVWDHIYEAPPAGGTIDHFEAIATLGALAMETTQARLGCLVFYVGYRNPGLLAKAAVTLDHLSNGRFELGLGAGWHDVEAAAYGYDFPSVGTRLDMLDEAAELITSLLRTPEGDEIPRTNHDGKHFRAVDASCLPTPVGDKLPIWIGGMGETKTLRTAARFADGWNAAYTDAATFAHKSSVLDRWCESEGRDPAEIERSVNLVFAVAADQQGADRNTAAIDEQWGAQAERIKGGALLGTPDQVVEQVMAYVEAGADMINIALRAPFDNEALDAYVTDVVPQVRRLADG